jgi:hypothetical protein
MSNRGDGSPSGLGDAPVDWGDGSPTPASWDADSADLGDGSPSAFGLVAELVGGRVFRDDGGEIVELRAEWPTVGPFRVRLYDVEGAAVPSDVYLHSGVPGQGALAYANAARDTLRCVLPPAPPGIYTIRIEWQPVINLFGKPEPTSLGWTQSTDVATTIRLATRYRRPQTWRMRSLLPPEVHRGATGPRSHRTERLLVEV